MPLSNAEIASKLGQMAALLREEGVNRFKVKAYHTVADAVRSFPQRLSGIVARGVALPKIPDVGAIGSAIVEIVQSGQLGSVQRLEQRYEPGTAEIAEAAKISIREAQRLTKALDVRTPGELREKLRTGDVAVAVGARLEFKVRHGLEAVRRLLWVEADELARHFQTALENTPGVSRIEIAGSLRRGQETVGTLQLVVSADKPKAVRAMLGGPHGGVETIDHESETSVRCKLAAGPMLIVRLASRANWGSALMEATGSREHLEEVAETVSPSPRRTFATEEAWYAARGLPWIAPELREGRGEVSAALKGKLPSLIELADIRGDLHTHTTASDGVNSLEEMVRSARGRGYAYLAITDHSKSLKITNGLDEKRLRAQMRAIDKLNATLDEFRVLKGSEVDILQDGSLDFGGDTLRQLDIVIASIHSRFGLDKAQQTRRLVRAIANPYVTCVGHLTGRKLLKRPGYELDLEQVLKAVNRHRKLLEINASPDRLDIDDALALRARQLTIPILINTDAHSTREFDFMAYGVRQARRGWQTPKSVVNTQPLGQLLRTLAVLKPSKGAQ